MTEIPFDPSLLSFLLSQQADTEILPVELPTPTMPDDWVPAGPALVTRTLVVHGRTHTIQVTRIVSSHPAHLARNR